MKKLILEKRLSKLGKQMFSLSDLVWDSKYHVDEEATAKVCPEYFKVCEEYERTANELNELKHNINNRR